MRSFGRCGSGPSAGTPRNPGDGSRTNTSAPSVGDTGSSRGRSWGGKGSSTYPSEDALYEPRVMEDASWLDSASSIDPRLRDSSIVPHLDDFSGISNKPLSSSPCRHETSGTYVDTFRGI